MYKSLKALGQWLALTAMSMTSTWSEVPQKKDWQSVPKEVNAMKQVDTDWSQLAFALPLVAVGNLAVGVARTLYTSAFFAYASAALWWFAVKRGFKRLKGVFGR